MESFELLEGILKSMLCNFRQSPRPLSSKSEMSYGTKNWFSKNFLFPQNLCSIHRTQIQQACAFFAKIQNFLAQSTKKDYKKYFLEENSSSKSSKSLICTHKMLFWRLCSKLFAKNPECRLRKDDKILKKEYFSEMFDFP